MKQGPDLRKKWHVPGALKDGYEQGKGTREEGERERQKKQLFRGSEWLESRGWREPSQKEESGGKETTDDFLA